MAKTKKDPTLAAILSFLIIGLGQIYCGQWVKAILFWLAAIVSFCLIAVGVGLILYPAVWVWQILDAYQSAKS